MKKSLFFSTFLLISFHIFAQPIETFLGGSGNDMLSKIIPAPGDNYYAVGSKNDEVWLVLLDPSGNIVWEKTYTPVAPSQAAAGYGITLLVDGNLLITGEQSSEDVFEPTQALVIKVAPNGNVIWKQIYSNISAVYDAVENGSKFFLAGWSDPIGSSSGGRLLLVNANGTLQWSQIVEYYSQTRVKRILAMNDGNFLVVGRTNVIGAGFEGIFLQKIEPNGNLIWEQTLDTKFREDDFYSGVKYNQALGAALGSDGSIWITNPVNYSSNIGLFHFSEEGELLEQKNYGSAGFNERPYGLSPAPDGGWLMTGESIGLGLTKGFAVKVDANGLELWRNYYGSDTSTQRLLNGIIKNDGTLFMNGMSDHIDSNGDFDGWLLNTESDGNILPWTVKAKAIIDLNSNCQADAGEPPAVGWFVSIQGAGVPLRLTDTNGEFSFFRADGQTQLSIVAPEPASAWTFCNESVTVESNGSNPIADVLFLVKPTDLDCPSTELSITQPDLERCETSRFFITISNKGLGESEALSLQLRLDPALELVWASEVYAQNGQIFDFQILPIEGFQEKTIEIKANLSCNVQLGATHAVETQLYPLQCTPAWAGPKFVVNGQCAGDEVQFSLKNEGGGGSSALTRYRVMADDLLAADFTELILPEGANAQLLTFPADGRTWRVELEQVSGFPMEKQAAVSIEGCGLSNNGLHSIAMRNAWRLEGSEPNRAAVFAPNTTGVANKIAEATHGFGLYNSIGDTKALEYTIRVRNPLQQPASKVSFHLTCSPTFDLRTFKVLASNAPVELKLDDNGVLRASMNLSTPLDTGNSAEAYAMLRFQIKPWATIPADSGQYSNMVIGGVAYIDQNGPFPLAAGFHNYSLDFPVAVDTFNIYPPEILRYGGRSYDFGLAMSLGVDDSVFLVGESSSFSEGTKSDIMLIKTDHIGKADWLNTIDLGDQLRSTGRGVAPLPDGGCILACNSRPINSDNSLNSYTASIVRVDETGKLLWNKNVHPAGLQYGAWSNGVIETGDDNFLMYGYSADGDINAPGSDQFYLKFNANGDIIWIQFEEITGSAFRPTKVVKTADGGFVFMGTNNSTVLNFDVYLEKIDGLGNKIWSKGVESEHGMYIGGLAAMDDDGLLLSGYSIWENTNADYIITPTFIRYTPNGNKEWEKNPILGSIGAAYSYNIIPAPGGGFYSIGEVYPDTISYNSDVMLLKIDTEGNPIWWHHYGAKNTESARAALLSGPNQLLMLGNNQSRPPLYDLQAILVCTDLEGNLSVGTSSEPMPKFIPVTVFPNPAGTLIHVALEAETKQPVLWEIRDIFGKKCRSGTSDSSPFTIGVEGLNSGLYSLVFPSGGFAPKRVVVVH